MEKETAEVVKQLADKLDVPVEHLWNGLVAYAPFEFYQWVALLIGCAFVLVIGIAAISYDISTSEKRKSDGGLAIFGFIVSIVAAGTFVVAGVSGMAEALAAKNAPEAWAAKKVLGRFVR